jgi:hypothetical protein
MATHALLAVEKFDAKELVGNATSFFGATTSSGKKKEKKQPDGEPSTDKK